MPDETTRAIDRIFDVIDNGVDSVHRVLQRTSQTEEKLKPKRRREIIDAEHAEKPRATEAAPATVSAKPHFYIVEAVDPKSGHTIFVVTDGRHARTECSTREFAAQILRALEKSSGPSRGTP